MKEPTLKQNILNLLEKGLKPSKIAKKLNCSTQWAESVQNQKRHLDNYEKKKSNLLMAERNSKSFNQIKDVGEWNPEDEISHVTLTDATIEYKYQSKINKL